MFIKWESKYKDLVKFEVEYLNALKLFSMEQFADKEVFTLSGGEKKRVELAQIFMMKPDIVLFDEPTTGLDCDNKKYIVDMIGKVFKDSIVILVSHDEKKYFSSYKLLKLDSGGLDFYEEV